jgi:glycerol uptake facilitator-like aquaporin
MTVSERPPTSTQESLAEVVGAALYACANVGAGLMAAQKLSDDAEQLLVISLATGTALMFLTLMFERVSGAYFNPAQTFADACELKTAKRKLARLVAAQVVGAMLGVWLAHAMFEQSIFTLATEERSQPGQVLGEAVATAGLLLVSRGTRGRPLHALAVGGFIFAAHWFSSSMSLANPAMLLARAFAHGPTGVRLVDVPQLLAGQAGGVVIALVLRRLLFRDAHESSRA